VKPFFVQDKPERWHITRKGMKAMKRDIDLLLQILLDIEKGGSYTDWMDIDIEAYTPEQMDYHLDLLVEAGLIGVATPERGHTRRLPVRLTWDGHEFLDIARHEARWQKVQELAQSAGGLPFALIRAALLDMAKGETGEHWPAAG
jgi:hypothetical protein